MARWACAAPARSKGAGRREHSRPARGNAPRVDGLWIPKELREFTAQVVFRTPKATIQHFESGGGCLDPYYGMVDQTHFGDPAEMRDPKNEELAPDQVSIKQQGEEPVLLVVDLDPDGPGARA